MRVQRHFSFSNNLKPDWLAAHQPPFFQGAVQLLTPAKSSATIKLIQELPDLTTLCSEQKDELICSQHVQLVVMRNLVLKLEKRIAQLEARLALNSQNSSNQVPSVATLVS
jgi:hypothetical protein